MDAEPAAPHGYKPLVAFKLCPPGGVYYVFSMFFISTLLHLRNVVTLYQSGEWMFATLTLFGIAVTSFAMVVYFVAAGGVHAMIRDRLQEGVEDRFMFHIYSSKVKIEGAIIGFVTTYAFALDRDLELNEAVIACFSFILASKDLANYLARHLLGCGYPNTGWEFLGAVREMVLSEEYPRISRAIRLMSIVQALSEFAIFSFSAAIAHPAVVFLVYFAADTFLAYFASKANFNESPIFVFLHPRRMAWNAIMLLLLPTQQFEFETVFPMHLVTRVLRKCTSQRFRAIGIVVRIALLLTLCIGLDLPHGLIAMGTLGRPMGRRVLMKDFVQPLLLLLHNGTASIDGSVSIGSAVYRGMLLLTVAFCVPCYLLVLVFLTLKTKVFDGVPGGNSDRFFEVDGVTRESFAPDCGCVRMWTRMWTRPNVDASEWDRYANVDASEIMMQKATKVRYIASRYGPVKDLFDEADTEKSFSFTKKIEGKCRDIMVWKKERCCRSLDRRLLDEAS